ncbi:hypothetical protein FDZ74_08325, partial [bacterium]
MRARQWRSGLRIAAFALALGFAVFFPPATPDAPAGAVRAASLDTIAPVTSDDAPAVDVPRATIRLTATDDLSGVAAVYYRVDWAPWSLYGGPIVVSDAGTHTIDYYAVDNAGNVESVRTRAFLVRGVTDPGAYDSRLGLPAVVLVPGWMTDGTDGGDLRGLRTLLEKRDSKGSRVYGDFKVFVVPSFVNPTEAYQLDSDGALDDNVLRLATWMGANEQGQRDYLSTHRYMIIGHSYGGVMSRGLMTTGADKTIIGTEYARRPQIRSNALCVVQLGSPNAGSPLASKVTYPMGDLLARGVKLAQGVNSSPSTKSMVPLYMRLWNKEHAEAVVPIHRAAGSFLPAVLDEERRRTDLGFGTAYIYEYTLDDGIALNYINGVLRGKSSDGF